MIASRFYYLLLFINVNSLKHGGFSQTQKQDLRSLYWAMKYTPPLGKNPFHVLIVYSNLYCSGSLIRSRMVISAASCFELMRPNTIVIVKVGANSITDLGQVIEVSHIKKHEYYKRDSELDNDIVILMLKDHVTFGSNVKKIVLAEDSEIGVGSVLDVSGWGSANLDGSYINRQLCSEMKIVSTKLCRKLYDTELSISNFCVEYKPRHPISDNGGPVVYADMLVGVLSYGGERNSEPYYALVTNVTYFYKWIDVNVERLSERYCSPDSEQYDMLGTAGDATDNELI